MYKLTVKYNNADGLFRYDDAIRSAMSRWPIAEEISTGEDPKSHMRQIACVFEDDGDDSLALVDLEEILAERFGKGEVVYVRQPAESNATHEVVVLNRPKMPIDRASVLTFAPHGGSKHRADCGTPGPHGAQDIFYRYTRRLGWDFSRQADVLLNWCGDAMIEPLLQYIQDAGQVDDFTEFLADNFGDDLPAANLGDALPRDEGDGVSRDAGVPDRRMS